MSYRKLDANGKPLPRKGRTTRSEAVRMENNIPLYHYEITGAIPLPDGKRRQYRQRFWLPDDNAAEAKEREVLRKPPVESLSWSKAHALWLEANRDKRSLVHLANIESTIRRWTADFGDRKGVEDTTLADFSAWIDARSANGTGRSAQLDRSHLLAIARWCRSRGFVANIPFDHAPKPQDRTRKRSPATVTRYLGILEALPENMTFIWRLLALTGMRLGAACDLLESDMTAESFSVVTKGRAVKGRHRVAYTMTSEIRDVIKDARDYKERIGHPGVTTVFCNVRGNRWTPKSYGKRLRNIIESENKKRKIAGQDSLPSVTAHQLRHMAGTALGEKNFSIPQIMAALGQTNPASAKVYVDQTQKMRDSAIAAVADFLQISDMKNAIPVEIPPDAKGQERTVKVVIECPCCSRKFNQDIKIKAQP